MRWKHPLLTGFKKPTNCLTWWRRRATQLLLNRGRGQNPTGSHLDESLAKLGFRCTKPQIPRNKILMDGHYQLSDISFRRVRGLMVFLPFYLGLLGPLSGSFSESPTPASDSAPDLVRRIFLEEMEPRDRHLGLLRQPAGKVEIRAAGEEQTGISLHEQLGYLARLQPICVGRRPSPGAANGRRYCAISSSESLRRIAPGRIFSMKKLSSRTIVSPASERSACKAGRIFNLSQWSQPCGRTIASMYAMPFTASRCRLAQSNPSAEPQSWTTRVTLS